MLKPDFSALHKDVEAAAAARARGEKWCWRCARRAEQGLGGLCDDCAENDKSILPQLAQPNYHKWQGKKKAPADAAEPERTRTPEEERELLRIARRRQRRVERRAAARHEIMKQLDREQKEKAARLMAEIKREQGDV